MYTEDTETTGAHDGLGEIPLKVSVNKRENDMTTYTCKPHLNDSHEMATFVDSDPLPKAGKNGNLKDFAFTAAKAAIAHLDANGVETLGNNLAEKVEELGWIEKLTVTA